AAEKQSFSWLIKLLKGSAFFRSRRLHQLEIHTPFVNAVHEGTEFLVAVKDNHTEISVFDGAVTAQNQAGRVRINKGFIGISTNDQNTRVHPLTIKPEDAVQWALYYPPVVDYQRLGEILTVPGIQQALSQYHQGNVVQALTILDNIPKHQQDENYIALKASLLLTVGSVEEALFELNQAERLESNLSTVMALKAIIAVSKNQTADASRLALKATEINPQSALAKIALSYVYQAQFEIDKALAATEQASQLTPENSLAWARQAELQLATGDRRGALKSAQKAQSLNPAQPRTQTILGFTYLAQIEFEQAEKAFNQAIKLNSADPLARLGLGLSKIRAGSLEEGTRELETAVSLDPDNAIMRSYLGKAYYELKNESYAATELAIAKEMDPKDPTPWFYDAILKQTSNRPIEALHDMQKAIELNDNRGVYRSKLLLDEDLAARSASLGRIYNDLGFQQLGLVEGWKSVTIDPANYSAHRLLADNYAALPRHEIARVSSLLQSQLLQPINITP
ncbi:MAG: tetratricopeptide repeat protein, partial [Methyloprofundus sp.]|nr:tetratricopeptide repeat protein [Methyloprofundus sp.]